MAGHSKFKNIQHRKGAQDKKRAKIFSKLAKEITVAAKMGMPDPEMNPRLRTAIAAARAANMPNDRIKRAVASGSPGGDDTNYEEIRYEGYGPAGIAIIVEALTDNRNRTAGEVRTAFAKNGGSLGESNSVSFMFDRVGMITYPVDTASDDEMFEAAVEAGAENVENNGESHEITTAAEDLFAVQGALAEKYGDPSGAELAWIPQNTVAPTESQAQTLFKLIDALEDSDDVQNVSANFDIDDAMMEKLMAAG